MIPHYYTSQRFTSLLSSQLPLLLLIIGLATSCKKDTPTTTHPHTLETTADSIQKKVAESQLANSPQIRLISEQIQKDTTNAELYFTRANLYLKANALQQAAEDFYKAIQKDSLQAPYYLATADLYLNVEQLPAAVAVLEKGNALIPNNPALQLALGKYNYYGQRYDVAKNYLDKVIKQQPDNAEAYFWRGMWLIDNKKPTQALTDLEKAQSLDPDLYNAPMVAAGLYADAKNDKAITKYNDALLIDPASIEAHYGKAMYLQNTKRYKEAEAEYRLLLQKDPQYADAFHNIGYMQLKEKQYQKAVKNFTLAIRVSPAFANAYYNRGLAQEALGNTDLALSDFKNALNFNPELTKAAQSIQRINATK